MKFIPVNDYVLIKNDSLSAGDYGNEKGGDGFIIPKKAELFKLEKAELVEVSSGVRSERIKEAVGKTVLYIAENAVDLEADGLYMLKEDDIIGFVE